MDGKVLLDEEVFVFVAPDGTPQAATIGEDYAASLGIAALMHSYNFGMSPEQMFAKGFVVVKAKATFVQIGTPESAFEEAKKDL